MIVEKDEWSLFKKLSQHETEWRKKNTITCKKCFYGCYKESNPHCDYIGYEHKSKRCTGLTCIQRGMFKPSSSRVNVEKVWSKLNEWINEQIKYRFATLEDVRAVFDRWGDPLGHYTELSGGGDSQRSIHSNEEGLQTDEVHEA